MTVEMDVEHRRIILTDETRYSVALTPTEARALGSTLTRAAATLLTARQERRGRDESSR